MVRVAMSSHVFRKTNLVTRARKAGDHYKCELCGLEGDRVGLDSYIMVKADRKCDGPPQRELPERVRITRYNGGGFDTIIDGKEYDVVPCPAEYYPKFKNEVWVQSEKSDAPIRLFRAEYEPLEVKQAPQLPMF